MALKEKILFITGKLAERSLKRVINEMGELPFDYEIRNLNISVASLLTTQMIERRIGDVSSFDKIIIPGRTRGDISILSKKLKVDFVRGPEELKDLPNLFGKESFKTLKKLRKLSLYFLLPFTLDWCNTRVLDVPWLKHLRLG